MNDKEYEAKTVNVKNVYRTAVGRLINYNKYEYIPFCSIESFRFLKQQFSIIPMLIGVGIRVNFSSNRDFPSIYFGTIPAFIYGIVLSFMPQFSKELIVGDTIDVYLDKIENHNGECILSRSKAKSKEIWGEIEKSFESGELVEGVITGKVKGGLSCEIGVTAFLPGSQIDTRPVRDVSHLIDVPQKFKILKMD